MTEKKSSIPKPTIRTSPPVRPPVTSLDAEEAKAPEVEKEEEPEIEEVPVPDDVEVDLVKRFLGAFVDGVVAIAIAYLVGTITGMAVLQYFAWAIVILTRDSLPFLEGQSIGKKVMKMKAVKEDGSSLSEDWVTGATRNVLLAIPFVGVVECFVILKRSGKAEAGRRLGDEWAQTKVIAVE